MVYETLAQIERIPTRPNKDDAVSLAFKAYKAAGGPMNAVEWHIRGDVPKHPPCNLCHG